VAGDRWWRGFDAVVLDALPKGSRVLDVGCGEGGFVDLLAAHGLDSVGVDPNAPARPRLIQEQVEHASSIGHFDAVCAVMALHHADLEPVLAAIVRLLRPDGRLFVDEFSWEHYDERAAAWVAAHDEPESVEDWRAEHGDLHTGGQVRSALDQAFDLLCETERPYLARMLDKHPLEHEEQRLIDAGGLPALGWRYCGVVRASG
jgi:SAM-dependent methyltransferase